MAKNITVIGINYYPEDSAIGLYTTQKVEALVSKGTTLQLSLGFLITQHGKLKENIKQSLIYLRKKSMELEF